MNFGVYAVRDVKSGFQTPTCQVNDAVAIRGFASAVMQSDSVLFTHCFRYTSFLQDGLEAVIQPWEQAHPTGRVRFLLWKETVSHYRREAQDRAEQSP